MEPVIHSKGEETSEKHGEGKNRRRLKASSNRLVSELGDILKTVVIAFAIMLLLNVFVFNLSMVKGQSMMPTLEGYERLFVDKLVYNLGHPKKGDVVVLKDPSIGTEKKSFLVKRVVGVPGDTVEVRKHTLFVNGKLQDEPYTDVKIEGDDIPAVQLGEKEYYVMGDNRHAGRSKDSRFFGSVQEENIIGRAEFVFWPISKIRGL